MTLDLEVGSSSWNTITNFLGTSYTLNGLSDGTDYEFEVRSMCGGGYYSSWVSATFTTVLACTRHLPILSSSSVTPSSATISWDAVNGARNTYMATRIVGATGWVDDDTASTNTVSLTGHFFLSEVAQIRVQGSSCIMMLLVLTLPSISSDTEIFYTLLHVD